MNHYVYRLDNAQTGEFYFGSRTCKCDPVDDDYMGSPSVWEPNPADIKKEILMYGFSSKDEAIKNEALLIENNIDEPNNRNYHIPPDDFHTHNLVTVKDAQTGETMMVSKNDLRYKSGELVHINKNKMLAKNDKGEFFRVSVDDLRLASGELMPFSKNRITVKDSKGNFYSVSINDPRYISGELVPARKGVKFSEESKQKMSEVKQGKVNVVDSDGNCFQVSTDDPRYQSGELTHVMEGRKISEDQKDKMREFMTGKVTVKDKSGNKFMVSKNDPRYQSGELVSANKGHKRSDETKQNLSNSKTGSKNPNYGKFWIYSDELEKSKMISKDEPIPDGWQKGRKLKFN